MKIKSELPKFVAITSTITNHTDATPYLHALDEDGNVYEYIRSLKTWFPLPNKREN